MAHRATSNSHLPPGSATASSSPKFNPSLLLSCLDLPAAPARPCSFQALLTSSTLSPSAPALPAGPLSTGHTLCTDTLPGMLLPGPPSRPPPSCPH